LFLSADGNFRLQRKNKRGDPDDVSLNDGRAYFVENSNFLKYVEEVGDSPEVSYSFVNYNPPEHMHAHRRKQLAHVYELPSCRISRSSRML
jgi:hypothetical protein